MSSAHRADFVVRAGGPDDVPAWHRARWRENEDNGAAGRYFAPHVNAPWARSAAAEDRDLARLCAPLTTPGWLRLWLAVDAGKGERGEVLGHLTLAGATHAGALHRATLGIGLVAAARGQGLGSALLVAALGWAREQRTLAWVDLCVFYTNPSAERLYRRLGFRETGRVDDALRVEGVSIGEVHLTLSVGG